MTDHPDTGRASRLKGVELRRVRLPLRQPWHWHRGIWTEREVILVRAVGPDSEGWGECAAFAEPTYTHEWVDGAWNILARYLVPRVLGGPVDAQAALDAMAFVQGHQMAKTAVELAILDAELRASGQSLASRLGATTDRVMAGVAVSLAGSLPELLDQVDRQVEAGYRRVKLKIEPGWDVEPVTAVRARHPDLALQVDANGAYRLDDADRLAPALDEAALLCLEQPLATEDLLGHARWAQRMRTPVCLDESIPSYAVAETALALGACGVVNIKAPRVGGYLEAVRIHDLCAAAGVPVWVGGLFETGVGRHANLALAALPNFTIPGDLSASGRHYAEDITQPVTLDADGMIAVPDRPGTGAEIRPDVLDATTGERQWFGSH